MGFLKRDDDSAQQQQASAQDVATTDAPHAAAYDSGSMAGIPASGLERIARMKLAHGTLTGLPSTLAAQVADLPSGEKSGA